MVYKKLTIALLATWLTACGGGGSGETTTTDNNNNNSSGGGNTPGKTDYSRAALLAAFPGNKADALLTETNIGPYLDSVLDSDSEFTGAFALDRSTTRASRADSSQGVYSGTTTIPCESGKATVVASRDTKAGLATMDFTYSQCLQDGDTLNGHQVVQYQGMFEDVQDEPSDYTLSFDDLSISNKMGTERYKGTMQVTGEDSCDQKVVYNIVMVSSDTTQSMLADNLMIRDKCISEDDPNSVARSVSGDLYAGNTGRISVSSDGWQLSKITNSQKQRVFMPIAGALQLASAQSSVVLSSWLDGGADSGEEVKLAHTKLIFKPTLSSSEEKQRVVSSRYLLEPTMYDFSDSDQDGMPDGWERQYGTDPNVADGNGDIDNDGLSNLQAFFAGALQQKDGTSLGSSLYPISQQIEATQDKPLDLPLSIRGRTYRSELEYASRVDLVLDLSAISTWDLSVNGTACQLEANNTRLRCPDIELQQFVSEYKTLALGSLHMTPKSAMTVSLSAYWENGFPFQNSSLSYATIMVISSASTHTVTNLNRGYVLSELDNELSHTLQFARVGGQEGVSSKKVTVTGKWSSKTGNLTLVSADTDGGDWVCKVAPTQFSCTSVDEADMMPLTLHFAKPATSGKTVIQYQVNTDYGFIVRQESASGTLAYGDTSALQQQLQEAEAAGKSEFVIPKGTYVGRLLNDPAHPLTLKAESGAELWLATNDRMDSRTFLQAKVIDGLTIHAEKPLKATEAIRNSHINLLPADFDWVRVDAPLIEANQISVAGYDTRCFSLSHDVLLRNNRVLAGSGDTPILFSGSIYETRPKLTLVNNTLSNIHSLTDSSNLDDQSDWVLINNLFINPPRSTNVLTPLFGYVDSYTLSHNLLPSAYQSLGGTNIYTDTPGVDADKGYGLNADSPALDAGDSAADSGLTDLYGNGRLVGKAMDIGAVERQ